MVFTTQVKRHRSTKIAIVNDDKGIGVVQGKGYDDCLMMFISLLMRHEWIALANDGGWIDETHCANSLFQ